MIIRKYYLVPTSEMNRLVGPVYRMVMTLNNRKTGRFRRGKVLMGMLKFECQTDGYTRVLLVFEHDAKFVWRFRAVNDDGTSILGQKLYPYRKTDHAKLLRKFAPYRVRNPKWGTQEKAS